MKWYAFFSQTGSEIVDLSHALKRVPDLIVSNNFEEKIKFNPKIRKLGSTVMQGEHDLIMTYCRNQTLLEPEDAIITLHGYLRILPADICTKYEIYNGHPAAIGMYPELKGKDPQIRTWAGRYTNTGSVVHRVTAGVDEGEIISTVFATTKATSLEELYGILRQTSLQSWIDFLKMRFK